MRSAALQSKVVPTAVPNRRQRIIADVRWLVDRKPPANNASAMILGDNQISAAEKRSMGVPENSSRDPSDSGHFLGHLFGDWSYGVDHDKCGHCGLYRHVFEKENSPCSFPHAPGQRVECETESTPQLDFGSVWAIRPELSSSDIYTDTPCPDVKQFESREEMFEWLDGGGPIPNRDRRRYGRIAVRTLSEFPGEPFTCRTFRQFLADGLGLTEWPTINYEAAFSRALADEDLPISCKLAPDWDFDGIASTVRNRAARKLDGLRLISFPDQVSRIVDDLQMAFRERHPGASREAECCFLESWDVLRDVAEFCGKVLHPSPEARDLIVRAGRSVHECRQYIENGRHVVRTQLAVYVHEIRRGGLATRSTGETHHQPSHVSEELGLNSPARAESDPIANPQRQQQCTPAEAPGRARAKTVAKLIRELDVLGPQMFEDESEYEELRKQYPDFLVFEIAEKRRDLRRKIVAIQGSRSHIRLAQELAGAHHGRKLTTIQTDWKHFKPGKRKRSR